MLEYQEMDPREWKECALLAAAAFYDNEWIIPYAKERGAETLSLFTNSVLNNMSCGFDPAPFGRSTAQNRFCSMPRAAG